MRIKKMTSAVAESVAAGEVIARPASVAKELLENSADATAGRAVLEVIAGGHEMLRLSDDGSGIHADDLLLSLESHTTSKLASVEDLNRICTYGFRGEALASIRAVSRLCVASATQDGQGLVVRATAEQVDRPQPADMPRGTRVQVDDLFFNVPARRKFLATPATEYRHIRRVFQQFALARPEMALELHNGGKCELNLPPAKGRDQLRQRLIGVVGKDWGEGLIPLEATAAGMQLYGWMGNPDRLQSRPQHQYFLVNDRPVFDRLLSSAARAALGASIGRSAHPMLAVWLQVEPSHLDVNVHPAKEEVRFLYSRSVHGLMREAVTAGLAGRTPPRRLAVQTEVSTGPGSHSGGARSRNTGNPAAAASLWVRPSDSVSGQGADTPADTASAPTPTGEPVTEAMEFMSLGRPLAQLQGIFILAENSEGLVIVDAHAAHERCLLEKARDQMTIGHLQIQPLLTPLLMEVGVEMADVAEENSDKLQQLGLDIDRAGRNEVAVRAAPSLLAKVNTEELVRTVLADIAEVGSSDATTDALTHLVGNLCCRAATRAGMDLSQAEMDELLRAMERLPHSAYCNHGRPSWHQVSISELNRLCHRGR